MKMNNHFPRADLSHCQEKNSPDSLKKTASVSYFHQIFKFNSNQIHMNTTTNKTNPTGWAKWQTFGWSLLVLFLLGLSPTWAQTDRIPVADGAFSNGATFPANGWTVSNGTNHQWIVNSGHALGAPFAGDAAYVTNASPAYAYTPANNSNNFFWRDVTVPSGETAMTLSFNWNLQAETNWDLWQVFVGPTTITPVGNNTHPGSGAAAVPPPIAGATT